MNTRHQPLYETVKMFTFAKGARFHQRGCDALVARLSSLVINIDGCNFICNLSQHKSPALPMCIVAFTLAIQSELEENHIEY